MWPVFSVSHFMIIVRAVIRKGPSAQLTFVRLKARMAACVDFQLAMMVKRLLAQRTAVSAILVNHRVRRDVMLQFLATGKRLPANEAEIRTTVTVIFASLVAEFQVVDTAFSFHIHAIWFQILHGVFESPRF